LHFHSRRRHNGGQQRNRWEADPCWAGRGPTSAPQLECSYLLFTTVAIKPGRAKAARSETTAAAHPAPGRRPANGPPLAGTQKPGSMVVAPWVLHPRDATSAVNFFYLPNKHWQELERDSPACCRMHACEPHVLLPTGGRTRVHHHPHGVRLTGHATKRSI